MSTLTSAVRTLVRRGCMHKVSVNWSSVRRMHTTHHTTPWLQPRCMQTTPLRLETGVHNDVRSLTTTTTTATTSDSPLSDISDGTFDALRDAIRTEVRRSLRDRGHSVDWMDTTDSEGAVDSRMGSSEAHRSASVSSNDVNMPPTAVVAMSGGVDSSVTAAVLKDIGFNVIGVFMRNWNEREEVGNHQIGSSAQHSSSSGSSEDSSSTWSTIPSCSSDHDYIDAASVAASLEIPLHLLNFEKEYWVDVFERMCSQYSDGVTPNPDVYCNRHVKFGALVETLESDPVWRQRLLSSHTSSGQALDRTEGTSGVSGGGDGSWFLATGHYARLVGQDHSNTDRGPNPPVTTTPRAGSSEMNSATTIAHAVGDSSAWLRRGRDPGKDQSYFLSMVDMDTLRRRALFPLGTLIKDNVRLLASRYGLAVAGKQDSVGICFIGKRRFADFLHEYVARVDGVFRQLNGDPVPVHLSQKSLAKLRKELRDKQLRAMNQGLEDEYSGGSGSGSGGGGGGGGEKPQWTGRTRVTATLAPDIDNNNHLSAVQVRHGGFAAYTLGQRARIPGQSAKWYVCGKHHPDLILCEGRDNLALLSRVCYIGQLNWLCADTRAIWSHPSFQAHPDNDACQRDMNSETGSRDVDISGDISGGEVTCQIRYNSQAAACTVAVGGPDAEHVSTLVPSMKSNRASNRQLDSGVEPTAWHELGSDKAHVGTSDDIVDARASPEPTSQSIESLDNLTVRFDAPQTAVTPGQIAVVYVGDKCVVAGEIQAIGLTEYERGLRREGRRV